MQISHKTPFGYGYTPIVTRSGVTADMLMEFGIIKILPGEKWEQTNETDEQCLLLSGGSAHITWMVHNSGGGPQSADISRPNLFDYSPYCLSVPNRTGIIINAGKEGAEFCYTATGNPKRFKARLFTPDECMSEMRGAGTMLETSTRIVRTVFDDSNHSESNLVMGEVIGLPGKWSSYPPHHHPQPEIYHYRFLPSQGFGLCAIGNTPHIIRDKDTILIREGEVHPHAAAPGYAMWYLWVIRHLDGAHYGPASATPIFADEHKWVTENQEKIWQPK